MEWDGSVESLYRELCKYSTRHLDPWEKAPGFALKSGVEFPREPGVYVFVNKAYRCIYYIGKAKSLRGRLTNKLGSDYRDRRRFRRTMASGYVNHEYPYLAMYQQYETELYTYSVSRPKNAETMLLVAHKFATTDIPRANRRCDGWREIISNRNNWELLSRVWRDVLQPVCGDEGDYGAPSIGPADAK